MAMAAFGFSVGKLRRHANGSNMLECCPLQCNIDWALCAVGHRRFDNERPLSPLHTDVARFSTRTEVGAQLGNLIAYLLTLEYTPKRPLADLSRVAALFCELNRRSARGPDIR